MPSTPSARLTKYAALADLLREQVSQGILHPGDRLPSLGEMRSRHSASLATVDKALGILEKEGLITRINGIGIFVADPRVNSCANEAEKPLLGLILPDCVGEFFSQIIEGVEKESRAAGYHLIVANSYGDHAVEAQLLRQLATQTVGLCVMACGTGNQAAFATLLEQKRPFVLLDRLVEGLKVPLVATDNERGGYLATRHLLESGCQCVYAISEHGDRASSLRERVVGFRKALAEANVFFEAALVRQTDDDPARLGYLLTKEVLESLGAAPREKTKIGIFALNEFVARGCFLAIKESGLKIPADIAVVGFDDTTATLFEPPLTTIRQDLTGIGCEGVKHLLELIRTGASLKPRQIRLRPELVVRNSSDVGSQFCSISQMLNTPLTPQLAAYPPASLWDADPALEHPLEYRG